MKNSRKITLRENNKKKVNRIRISNNLFASTKSKISGITIISLIVTIIALLILSGVGIATLTGENGILRQTVKAKDEAEIASEKEIINTAVNKAIEKDIYGELIGVDFQKELEKITGKQEIELTDLGNSDFEIDFKDSGRYYEIDANCNIEQVQVIGDTNPGDIKKGIKGETLLGTEESPFEIWCIEDLIE